MGKAAKQITTETGTEEFGGLNPTECSFDCSPKGCIISGTAFCAHPNKGGADRVAGDPDALARYQRARKQLAMQAVKKRPD